MSPTTIGDEQMIHHFAKYNRVATGKSENAHNAVDDCRFFAFCDFLWLAQWIAARLRRHSHRLRLVMT